MGLLMGVMLCAGLGRAEDGKLGADALKANPWVAPPKTAEETQERVAGLKKQYAPYLSSLPKKLEVRDRKAIAGPWRSQYEVTDSPDGKRPETPDWFSEGLADSAWELTTVPEWRWAQRKNQKTARVPVSCILWYRTRFAAEASAAGRRTWLCFDGVDWEAEVWLNGTFLGRHKGYYEPFRFDVTRLLKIENTLAVRVIDGPAFGEPHSFEAPLENVPCLPESNQRIVRDRAKSCIGIQPKGEMFLGSGYGIHREVYLETTGEACVADIFARGYPSSSQARVTVALDAAAGKDLDLEVQLLPENFKGESYKKSERMRIAPGAGKQSITLSAPGAKWWWPAEPNLYRCRVILRDGQTVVDSKDVLFGFRSFGLVSKDKPVPGYPQGRFVLNGRPLFLRGTNIGTALNGYSYWNEPENLLTAALMLKAANFNAVRSCQYVCFLEVRELFDRLGILSEQDQGHGSEIIYDTSPTLAETGAILARTSYNNPGVVLLSFANETHHDATAVVSNALAIDPERIIIPASGGSFSLKNAQLRGNVVDDIHLYDAWYKSPCFLLKSADPFTPRTPVATMGEYGGEALDAYETMCDHYPENWGPPPRPDEDRLWGAIQVRKGSLQQLFGFRGVTPTNLLQHIEASQTYQADVLAEATKGIRLSPRAFTGYFQYHFLDGMPARWPKSIVSHDLRPKQGYFEMAQMNQPLVPLYRLVERGQALEIWVVNELPVALHGGKVRWSVRAGDRQLEGEAAATVAAGEAVNVARVDLKSLPAEADRLAINLTLSDASERKISEYGREIYRNYELIDRAQAMWDVQDVSYWVHESVSVNVAKGKPVTATSAGPAAPAANAVDGKLDTAWQPGTEALPQVLTVDLGDSTALCGARIVWAGEKAGKLTLEFSDDQATWTPAPAGTREASEVKAGSLKPQRIQYFAFKPKARYVRATVIPTSDGKPVGLAELELHRKK
jgi:hypothetical protein